jgi:hypothetical protein
MAIAEPQAERASTVSTDAETQQHLLELRVAIFVVSMDRAWGHRGGRRLCLLRHGLWVSCIGPIEGNRRRILMEPQRREGLESKAFERHGPKHLVQVGGKQRVQALAQTVIVAGDSL